VPRHRTRARKHAKMTDSFQTKLGLIVFSTQSVVQLEAFGSLKTEQINPHLTEARHKGLVEGGLGELVGSGLGDGNAAFKRVGQFHQGINAADDLGPPGSAREWNLTN
jgi:hypothetical protein